MYEWIKALHVIAVISWMAGMLYLPRLFVYHCEAEAGSKQSETFKVMERRLLKAIINPAMIVTWLAGLYLAWAGHWYLSGWFHAKFTPGADDVGYPRLFVLLGEGFRRGPESAAARNSIVLSTRYLTLSDGPDRDPGGRQAVLDIDDAQHRMLQSFLRRTDRFSI